MPTYDKPILVASSITDRQTYTSVLEELSRLGHETVLYESDDVISGKARFVAEMDDSGQLNVQYNNRAIGPDAIALELSLIAKQNT